MIFKRLHHRHLAGEDTLQLLCREAQLEFAFHGDTDATGLLTDYDGHGIAVLRYAHGGAVTQTQLLRNIGLMAHGEDTSRGTDALVRYDHGTVVERRVLEEDILYQPLVDFRVNDVAGIDNIVEGRRPLYDDKCTHLATRHIHASHDNRHY